MNYRTAKLWAFTALSHVRNRTDDREERRRLRDHRSHFYLGVDNPPQDALVAAWSALRALSAHLRAEDSHKDAAHVDEARTALEAEHGPLNPLAPYMETDS